MIKTNKSRVMLTLPKKQIYYLRKLAETQKKTVSEVVSQLCNKKSEIILEEMTPEYLYEIAHAKWID